MGGWSVSDLKPRLFLALPIPQETKGAVLQWAKSWSARDDGWRWVRPEGIHLTLRFFGETSPDLLPALVESTRRVAAAAPAFDLSAVGWGVFPNPARPRVLWVGVRGAVDQVQALAAAAEDAARGLGFAPEKRTFHPHLTLARAREGMSHPRLPGAPDPGAPSFGALPARELILFESHLGPAGARYEAVVRAVLGRGGEPTGA